MTSISEEETLHSAVIIVFNIIASLTVVTNCIHLWIVSRQKKLNKVHWNNYRLFLVVLGCMDLSIGISRVVLSNSYMQGLLDTYDVVCTATGVFINVTYASMTTTLLMVSIDRTCRIHHTLKSYKSVSFVRLYPHITTAIILTYCTLFITLGILFNGRGFSIKDLGNCNMGSHEIPLLAAPLGFIVLVNLIVITLLYTYTITVIRLRASHRRSQTQSTCMAEATMTIGCIICACWVCWLPPILSSILWAFGISSVPLEICALLSIELNSLANPVIYGLNNSVYRNTLRSACAAITNRVPSKAVSSQNETTMT